MLRTLKERVMELAAEQDDLRERFKESLMLR